RPMSRASVMESSCQPCERSNRAAPTGVPPCSSRGAGACDGGETAAAARAGGDVQVRYKQRLETSQLADDRRSGTDFVRALLKPDEIDTGRERARAREFDLVRTGGERRQLPRPD